MVVDRMRIFSHKKPHHSSGWIALSFGALTALVQQMDSPSDLPIYVFLTLTVIFAALAIFDWCRQFFPKRKLPIALKSSGHLLRSTLDSEISESFANAIIECDKELFGQTLRITYAHKHWGTNEKIKISQTIFGTLSLSDFGKQKTAVIVVARKCLALDFGVRAPSLHHINFILADKILSGLDVGEYNQVDIVFAHDDYESVRKTLWVSVKGHIFFKKPEGWPNDETREP